MPNLVDRDPWLEPYRAVLERREHHYGSSRYAIEQQGGLLGAISQGHRYFGLQSSASELSYREWAPAAKALSLIGDFNGWDRGSHPLDRDEFGVWHLRLPVGTLEHGARHKVHVVTESGGMDRIPAYARRVVQDENGPGFTAEFWNPGQFPFKNQVARLDGGLRIYEAHVGMATEEYKVGTFREFADKVLPRVARLGYNAVQLMAIQEHPYYGSFGYQVSNFFAVSSRFGTPEDLKELVERAHSLGLRVIMDLVHSHSVKNTAEGLYLFDGTQHQYFHAGARGLHSVWDSALFDYSKFEVQRFLLSNVRYWLEEFRFDGFRFDGVTSMLYHSHGLGEGFSSYDNYFGGDVDEDALLYLKLANEVAHAVNPASISIGEDVSGFPGLARPVSEWGVGFDYRLAMGIPDFWIKQMKRKDEDWSPGEAFSVLRNRRLDEKHIGYAESHDQAMVGDKTIAFWLMDAEMYGNMSNERESLVIDRGIALHKMIRLMTFSLGGEGYLNFMGNEFGHPEWIDFPREGNGWSYHFARRQWSLADNGFLRYQKLDRFDLAMQHLDPVFGLLTDPLVDQLACHESAKELVFRHGPLVFAFNFNSSHSAFDFRIPVPEASDYLAVLTSDEPQFGGHGRIEIGGRYSWLSEPMYGWTQSSKIYLPARTALVMAPERLADKIKIYRKRLAL